MTIGFDLDNVLLNGVLCLLMGQLKVYKNSNQYYGNGPERTKGEVCKKLGIEIFVDDFLHNVEDVANLGIPALLFDAPWNQGEVKPLITRVFSWDDIVDVLSK